MIKKTIDNFNKRWNIRLTIFMEYKQFILDNYQYIYNDGLTEIQHHLRVDLPRYFDYKDKDFLMKMDKNLAKIIVEKLRKKLKTTTNYHLFSGSLCPYCLIKEEVGGGGADNCIDCDWGKNHGKCLVYNSSYQEIDGFYKWESSINRYDKDIIIKARKALKGIYWWWI